VLKIIAARPDAVFAGNSGTPGALPYLGLAERGYKGQIYGTHGVFTFKPNDPYGLDKRSALVIKLDKGQWKLAE
jgi:ABC-type branched-subunit amino acid transport system substrate-binding protein